MKTDLNKLAELYYNAPKQTQAFINSGKLHTIFVSLEKEFNLKEEETKIIQEQTISFLFGLTSLDEIETEISLVLRDRNRSEMEKIINLIKQNILIKRSS